ncbi:twitching motility protein PilT [Okibacterium sp. HSC-33S16]|uniref:type IV pilus twitching motility protein PilT n=1 Tax=Okibacterium sp. HSC-33S16 TaxID=2910965 RepID=UPI0027E37448|nr:type IV pilus twitching motility protein PilT [Okibacterium sp. HSC-33S16]MCP2029965.1 twitching motility protein PilT [Okibacterium sp. HSC-33S16]
MSDPIYEIPILPAGTNVAGWTPGIKPRTDAATAVTGGNQPDSATPVDPVADEPSYAGVEAFDDLTMSAPLLGEGRQGRRARAADTAAITEQLPAADAPTMAYAQPIASAVPSYLSTVLRDTPGTPMTRSEANRRAQAEAASRLATGGAESAAQALADISLEEALAIVVSLGASDLHITADAPPMIRVNGALRPIDGAAAWSREKATAELAGIVTDRQREAFYEHLELDFAHTLTAESRFRANYYMQRGAIGAAFRLIPTEIKRLSDLGVPDTVSRFAALPRGLVLVTGPTGSGKSTTLAGLIDLVNRTRADHIVTVEDPIEFMHTNQKSIVNQREVGADTHSFGNALKHVLRQDPDVILIGELRDLETISVALTAAETGHLVFATLHTQDAAQTIDRMIDVFPAHQQEQVRTQLAGVLQGVVCQTLVPKASGNGRVVATEVMVITPALSNLIREGKTYQILSAMQAGKELGMHTMDQHLAELVNSGRVTRQAAEAKAHDHEGFARSLHTVQSPTEASTRAMQRSEIDFGDSFSTRVER